MKVSRAWVVSLLIHSTAGFIDAGFDGHITLELANVASLPITLYPGMKIGAGVIYADDDTSGKPVWQGCPWFEISGSTRSTPSRYFENFQDTDGQRFYAVVTAHP